MASPTQTVVGKGISNPLTVEDLLKILRDCSYLIPSLKSLTNSHPWNGKTTYKERQIHSNYCYVQTPLTVNESLGQVNTTLLTKIAHTANLFRC